MTQKEMVMKDVERMTDVVSRHIQHKAEQLYASGGVDLEAYEGNSTALAKILVIASMIQIADDYMPLYSESARADIKNLQKM